MKSIDYGILLHRSPYSNSSLLVSFFTLKNGLQKFIFKGGRKKAAGLFPIAVTEITYYGRNINLLNITEAELLVPSTFQFDPIKSTIAFFMAEVIRKCVHVGDSDPNLFLFLKAYSESLEKEKDLSLFPLEFLINMSEKLGFKPLIENGDMSIFNFDAGVFQHTHSSESRTFSGSGVDLIKEVLENNNGTKLKNESAKREALDVLLNYFSIHVPHFKKLESYEIVKEILSA